MDSWYASLTARVLDLVGDYAGRELFLLEGDSLVLHCLDDSRLDFQDGFQLLHAVRNVEEFLSHLIRSKCRFHIVFFTENRDTVANAATKQEFRSKYKLAREVLLFHLKIRFQEMFPVCEFDSCRSPAFREYAQLKNAYFIMCHNGALRTKNEESCLFVIHHMLSLGLDVAVINEIEWRDSKVITRVIQAASRQQAQFEAPFQSNKAGAKDSVSRCIEALQALSKLQQANPEAKLTLREHVTLAVLSALMEQKGGNRRYSNIASAFVLQLTSLASLSLIERRLPVKEVPDAVALDSMLDEFCELSSTLIQSPEFDIVLQNRAQPDLHDLIDGRLLRSCICLLHNDRLSEIDSVTIDHYHVLMKSFQNISQISIDFEKDGDAQLPESEPSNSLCQENDGNTTPLLPFQHKVFDDHLASVRVTVQSLSREESVVRGIQDNRHWHSGKLLIPGRLPAPQQEFTTKWRNPERRRQLQMRNMTKYAASLTNAKGNILEPETIISPSLVQKHKLKPTEKKTVSSKASKIVEQNQKEKLEKEELTCRDAWKRKLAEVRTMDTPKKVKWCSVYLEGLDNSKKAYVEAEVRIYILTLLINELQNNNKRLDLTERISLTRDIWDQIRILRQIPDRMTPSCHLLLQEICRKLGLPACPKPKSQLADRPLTFVSDSRSIRSESLWGPLSIQEFQLLHCGPYMDRQTGSKPDPRVSFEPDAWQREVLDELDADHSVFVVAPTSAGKTFISFYAMSKILRESDDGVLVYVAPTKALVNQIAAEIHARFRKTYPNADSTVWAIHTRDTRVNDPMHCQILVTVPHILQIMLLAPTNSRTWAPRVKCIIFDEIHSIGQADDGVVWEQLLLLAPCRMIGLSATVGNPKEFTDWLASTQKNIGVPLKLIKHNQRYSDLRKFAYRPPQSFVFKGLSATRQQKAILEAESIDGLRFIHPITSLLNGQRQMPEDLSLEPRDCYLLWKSMIKHASDRFPLPKELDPGRAMPSFVRRSDVFHWEAGLKKVLLSWMKEAQSPLESVRSDLIKLSVSYISPDGNDEHKDESETSRSADNNVKVITDKSLSYEEAMSKDQLCESAFSLLVGLHEKNALPALLFNYERFMCEQLAIATLRALEKVENEYKEGATWKHKLKEYEKYEAMKAKQASAAERSKKAGKRRMQSIDESEPDSANQGPHQFESFHPDRPLQQFSLANLQKLTWTELMDEIEDMREHVNPALLEALTRGIGVHHAGLNRHYRQCVERWFRAGFLRVVVATGTLALGINMPCSTVVFCGDSVYLTALNFRQAAGRAGRRGFDLLGNVIFLGVPSQKVNQLISSRLPDLNGHFPITTSLVLRLFILLHNSDESPYAIQAINALLSQPRLFLGGGESREKVLHHLRFSIEYLRRQHLLGQHGEPIGLACSVSHLYYTESSAFAFHALLRGGYFEELCRLYRSNTEKKLRTLMIVLAHLFGRKSLGRRYEELLRKKEEIKSPSIVRLPDIPAEAATVIRNHDREILETYSAYVHTFVQQHLQDPEKELPCSETHVGGAGNPDLSRLLGAMKANRSRSAFVGLSGHGDEFKSVQDLCETVRSGVYLEQSVVPHLAIDPDEDMPPLNAYLYDFFCHGCQEPLEVANRISRSDSWFLLNDFSLVLATIIVALENYLDPSLEQQANLLDVMGAGDMISEDESDEASEEPVVPSSMKTMTNTGLQSALRDESDVGSIPDDWDDADDNENDFAGKALTDDSESETGGRDNCPIVSMEVLETFRELKAQFDDKFYGIFA